MKKITLFSLFISFLFILSCSHYVTIRPNIDVTATIANQLDFKVGLFIPPEIKELMMQDKGDWANKYTFNVGEAVSSIIYKSFSRVFRYVEILETYPTEMMISERAFDFVAIARLTEANVGLNVQTGFFTNTASGNTQISAGVSFFDSKLIQFTSIQATGTGMGDEEIDLLSSGKSEFSVSVESAIRNLGNNLVQQIYGNYDIRKLADK